MEEEKSKSQKKREAEALQKLGVALSKLSQHHRSRHIKRKSLNHNQASWAHLLIRFLGIDSLTRTH